MFRAALFLLVCLPAFLFPAGIASSEDQIRKAVFIPLWTPQAQFAGYYVGKEKGIYLKYGIDLTILTGGPDHSASEYLRNGKADFVTLWLSTALQLRSEGVRLLNIGQIIRRSAYILVARKSAGIREIGDLNGKRISVWEGDFTVQVRAFLRKHRIFVSTLPQSTTPNLFLRGGVDAASAMWYNEYHTIINSGIDPADLTTFFFSDLGLNFPEDGIYVMEDFFRANKEFGCNFVKASIEGWMYAFAHPEETLDIVTSYMKQARMPTNRVHQRWMLARMKDLIITAEHGEGITGVLDRKDFSTVADILLKEWILQNPVEYETLSAPCLPHVQK